jgi:hypothetical protein
VNVGRAPVSLATAKLGVPEPHVIQLSLQARAADLARVELVHKRHGHVVCLLQPASTAVHGRAAERAA